MSLAVRKKYPKHPNTRIRSRNRTLNCQSPALRRSTASCIGSEFEAPAMRCQCPVDSWSFSPLFSGRDPHHPRKAMASPPKYGAIFHGDFLIKTTMENRSTRPWHPMASRPCPLCRAPMPFSVSRPWMKKREPTKGMKQRCYKWCILRNFQVSNLFLSF